MKLIVLLLLSLTAVLAWIFIRDNASFEELETISTRHETKTSQDKSTINAIYDIPENDSKETKAGISGIELRKCKNIPRTEHALDAFLYRANANDEPFQYIEDVLNRFEICKQYAHIKDNYVQTLIDSADNGSIDSLIEIWKTPAAEYFEAMGIDTTSREDIIFDRKEFVKTKYRLAQKLAISGSDEAVLMLVKSYQSYDPVSQKPSYIRSLAYANFGLQMTQDNDSYLKLNWFKQRILDNSSPEEIESAFSITERLLNEANHGEN